MRLVNEVLVCIYDDHASGISLTNRRIWVREPRRSDLEGDDAEYRVACSQSLRLRDIMLREHSLDDSNYTGIRSVGTNQKSNLILPITDSTAL